MNPGDLLAGDFVNLHTDEGQRGGDTSRALCLNYWLPSPGWQPAWGGGFLWCGAPGEASKFPAAARAQLGCQCVFQKSGSESLTYPPRKYVYSCPVMCSVQSPPPPYVQGEEGGSLKN